MCLLAASMVRGRGRMNYGTGATTASSCMLSQKSGGMGMVRKLEDLEGWMD